MSKKTKSRLWHGLVAVLGLTLGLLFALKTVQASTVSAASVTMEVGGHGTKSTWVKPGGGTFKEGGTPTLHLNSASGPVVFCIEPGQGVVGDGEGYTGTGYKTYQDSSTAKQVISAVAYYGYQKQKSVNNYIMTQWMIWEELGYKLQSVQAGPVSKATYQAFKNTVNGKVATFTGNPSFHNTTVTVKAGQSVTVTDNTGRFANYAAAPSSNTTGTTVKKNGNSLTIAASASSKDSGAIQFVPQIDANYQGTPLIASHATRQDVIQPRVDPVAHRTWINVKVEKNVNVLLQKYDISTDFGKNDPLAGVTFHFTKDGKDYGDFTTDAKGQISLNKNIADMTGNWTYQETKTVDGFKLDSTVKSFSIAAGDAGKTINLTATNERVPETIHTTATSEDGTHVQEPHKQVTITDRVDYENAVIGKKYTVTGVLMDKNTREALLDDNGKQITHSMTFTATATSGYVDMPFTFDAALLAGKTTVVFETLYRDGRQVAVHNDINDVPQTITFTTPKIGTTATDVDGSHDVLPDADLTIDDVVAYHDLVVGKTYTVKGQLMDQATGKVVLDAKGNPITDEKTFVAEKADGEIKMTYSIDASKAMGKSFVVFEDLYRDGNLIVSHADINDEGQTVKVVTPVVHTTATDDEGSKEVLPEEDVTIKDAVKYTDLVVGKEYTVQGFLHFTDGSFVTDAKGNKISKTVTFTAEKTDGTIDVNFKVDGRLLAGKDVVAFEYLYHNKNLIAFHEDVNDKNQTVHFPKINLHTTATSNGKKTVTAAKNMTINDVVAFGDLVVGKTYTVKGYLMDKATGKALLINGQKVTAEKTFKATAKDMKVTMTFNFDGSSLGGHDVVAFEDLYHDGKLIASHADINDAGQTVHIAPAPKLTQTDDSLNGALLALGVVALISAAGVAFYLLRKRA